MTTPLQVVWGCVTVAATVLALLLPADLEGSLYAALLSLAVTAGWFWVCLAVEAQDSDISAY